MKPYIVFKVSGIKGHIISDEMKSFAPNDDLVESVEITQSSDRIEKIKFILKENATDNRIINQLTKKVERFIVNIYGKLHPSINKFNLQIEQIYTPNNDDTSTLQINSCIAISDSITIICSYGIETFKELYDQKSPNPDADNIYMLLYNIMKIDNIVTRFLMQYELLLSLVAPTHKQKEVTEYIKNTYNPVQSYQKIGFHRTRKIGQTYDEDDLTYYRNLLGHNDSSEMVNDSTIKSCSNVLANVIYFKLLNP